MRVVRRAAAVVAVGLAAVSTGAHAVAFTELVVFGDSLSDTGNNAIALGPGTTPVPISGNTFVPILPYASGRYTNAGVWVDSFAARFGVSALPALAGGRNYAFGGATAGTPAPFPPTMLDQKDMFLADVGGTAPPGALYVVAGGGNNARDTFLKIAVGGEPLSIIPGDAMVFASDMTAMIGALTSAGATNIVLWTVPGIGATPVVQAAGPDAVDLANGIAAAMNGAMLAALDAAGLLDDVMLFDLFARLQAVLADPDAFGLTNLMDACARFTACLPGDPAFDPEFLSGHFFWDGIHPTSVGHAILASQMIAFVPEPGALVLLGIGLLALGWARGRGMAPPSPLARGAYRQAPRIAPISASDTSL